MAVPLTSDLPGTSTEAGGDIQVRSDSLSAETSFQVANSRNRVTQDVRARRAGRSKVAVVRVIRARVLVEVYPIVYAAYPQDEPDGIPEFDRESINGDRYRWWTGGPARLTPLRRSLLGASREHARARGSRNGARRSLGDFDARYGNNRETKGDHEWYRARGRYVVLDRHLRSSTWLRSSRAQGDTEDRTTREEEICLAVTEVIETARRRCWSEDYEDVRIELYLFSLRQKLLHFCRNCRVTVLWFSTGECIGRNLHRVHTSVRRITGDWPNNLWLMVVCFLVYQFWNFSWWHVNVCWYLID